MTAPFPPPDATRAEIEAWRHEHREPAAPLQFCRCGHLARTHTQPAGKCRASTCQCDRFEPKPAVTRGELAAALGGAK